jgi:hypothetical protein
MQKLVRKNKNVFQRKAALGALQLGKNEEELPLRKN